MSGKIMGRAWDLDLPHNKLLVLLAMADHADHDGNNVFPSIGLVAWKTGYSEDQVRRVISSLKADGILVEVARMPGKVVRYKINIDAGKMKTPRIAMQPLAKCNPLQDATPDPLQNATSTPRIAMQPEPSLEPSNKEPSEKRKRSPLKMKFPSNIRAYTSDQLATYNQQHITDMTALVLAWHGDMYTKGLTNIGIEDSKDYIEVHKEAIRLNIPITDYPALAKYTKKKEQWLTDKGSKIPIRLMLKYVTDYKPAPKKILYDDPAMDLSKPMPNILSKFQQDELERKARENHG